jgi:putative ABC transport system substrate-binding protein
MRRRELIALLGGAAIARPLAAVGQQAGLPVVGILTNGSVATRKPFITAFLQDLAETGYIDGKNVTLDFRWAGDDYGRLSELAADLVRQRVTLIAAAGLNAALVSKRATDTIPIVFGVGDDPVRHGLAARFNHPGANATGVHILVAGLVAKRLSLLQEFVPHAAVIALLVNPNNANTATETAETEDAAHTLGQQIEIVRASTEHEIEAAFVSVTKSGAKALVVGADQFYLTRSALLVDLAARYAIPTIYEFRAFVDAGGLASYGPNIADADRQQGIYTGKVLAGASPSDLPIIQPTKFELVVNLKTAQQLGLTIPPSILARADEVIE